MSRAFAALWLVAVAAFGQPPTTPDPVAQLRWVEYADPKLDVQRNIARGDTRFLVYNGISSNIRPGNASDERVAKHGIRLIDGTTDVPVSREHERLIRIAIKYAQEYNHLLLDYLRSHE